MAHQGVATTLGRPALEPVDVIAVDERLGEPDDIDDEIVDAYR